MEMDSLQVDKTITFFDSDELELYSNIKSNQATFKWVNDGEV